MAEEGLKKTKKEKYGEVYKTGNKPFVLFSDDKSVYKLINKRITSYDEKDKDVVEI